MSLEYCGQGLATSGKFSVVLSKVMIRLMGLSLICGLEEAGSG